MARDRAAEIAAIKARAPSGGWRGLWALAKLEWELQTGEPRPPSPQFVIVRLVTLLEVFTRDWVALLVDSGQPYIIRAAEVVKGSLKFDFAIAQALIGKRFSLGELVAHELKINEIDDIERIFGILIGEQLFQALEGVIDRYESEINKQPAAPIISDALWTRARLRELFPARHVIVHELPDSERFEVSGVDEYVRATSTFMKALDQLLSNRLYGDYPLTQSDMNAAEFEKLERADTAVREALKKLDPHNSNATLSESQKAWEDYRRLSAEFLTDLIMPAPRGTMAPMIYAAEAEEITRSRAKQLEKFVAQLRNV